MQRPSVTVVMPFAGDRAAAEAALASLRSLDSRGGDQLILVDNSSDGVAAGLGEDSPVTVLSATAEVTVLRATAEVTVLRATAEHSPAHARNAGAAAAGNGWILFIDADTVPDAGLLDAFFDREVDETVGAIAGEVLAAPSAATLAARYGAARNFLGQRAHYEHPYRPRAASANLLVRREAFQQLGGFYERVRAGEDTDFSWRLQEAGWRLELRPGATIEHRYRATIGDLRRQWRGYAAGRAWLGRRYREFLPEPAVKRALARSSRRGDRRRSRQGQGAPDPGRLERAQFLALDALLGVEELAGLTLSNRPSARAAAIGDRVDVVIVADRFPTRGDPLVELAGTLERVRVEAIARPTAFEPERARGIRVDYLEDEGALARWAAAGAFALRHPLRSAFDLVNRAPGAPPLRSVAPAARRLEHDAGARIHPLGGGRDHAAAARLARLAGQTLDR